MQMHPDKFMAAGGDAESLQRAHVQFQKLQVCLPARAHMLQAPIAAPACLHPDGI